MANEKYILSLHIGSVVQWIEFKIPVLTMKVRILSESLKRCAVDCTALLSFLSAVYCERICFAKIQHFLYFSMKLTTNFQIKYNGVV